jgi:ferredoxin
LSEEKLYPISANKSLCVRCEKCMYSCPSKAIFFKDSTRYVNYEKCEGCLRCVEACEHGAIEVISIKAGKLQGFYIDQNRCVLCLNCLESNFCFQDLFRLKEIENEQKYIEFKSELLIKCNKCLKCFKNCPFNAIIPQIE